MKKHKIPARIERGALYTIIALLGIGMILLIVQANDAAHLGVIRLLY